MGKLEGKIALITGGSSGLGLATAKRFVAEGPHVFITGRRQPELEAAVKEIGMNLVRISGKQPRKTYENKHINKRLETLPDHPGRNRQPT